MTSNDTTARGDHPLWLLSILGGALILRLILFTGIQGEDDRYYHAAALRIARGERPAPRDLFDTRIGMSVPVSLLYRVFGVREACLIAPALLASLLLTALAYLWGRRRGSAWTGRVAALFVALFPLDVVVATGAWTDLPLAAGLGLGAFLVDGAPAASTAMKRRAAAVVAGLSFGAAYLSKESALPLLTVLLPLLGRKETRKDLAIALAVFVGVVGLEMLAYGLIESDPLFRFHLAKRTQSEARGSGDGFWTRLFWLPSFCLNPAGPYFAYTAGLFLWAIAGAVQALRKDPWKSGGIAVWWIGSGYLLALSPLSLFPFRPAVDLQPRMFAIQVLPGALLAADVLVGALRPRAAIAVGLASALLALLCAVRLHQDCALFRGGAVWAHERLSNLPGSTVLTDPRTAAMLRVLARETPTYTLRVYTGADPIPPDGTLLLDSRIQAAGARDWDHVPPPPWWSSDEPRREEVAVRSVPSPWRLRGPRGPEERTILRRVAAHSPR